MPMGSGWFYHVLCRSLHRSKSLFQCTRSLRPGRDRRLPSYSSALPSGRRRSVSRRHGSSNVDVSGMRLSLGRSLRRRKLYGHSATSSIDDDQPAAQEASSPVLEGIARPSRAGAYGGAVPHAPSGNEQRTTSHRLAGGASRRR